jgi:uncharacterized membrane protein (DUF373 family)
MSGDGRGEAQAASGDPHYGAPLPGHDHPEVVVRLLVRAEHALLYVAAFALLAIGAAVLVVSIVSALVHHHPSWTERLVISVEGILLFLIVMEIFITVLTHAGGGRIQLEFFIVIGVIALVRHVLSVVVRLTIPASAAASRQRFWDLGVDAGAALVLVVALAIARWSARRTDAA